MKYTFQIHHEVNDKGRDFIIGDLHGMYEELMIKMKEVDFDYNKDRLFSVGDLIDRGPDSLGCLELLKEPMFFAVLGNHEDMMVTNSPYWFMNGGQWAQHLDNLTMDKMRALIRDRMPLTRTVTLKSGKTIGISHAQPAHSKFKELTNGNYDQQTFLWSRDLVTHEDSIKMEDVEHTYHGHTPLLEVTTYGDQTYLDTGACFPDGFLTMLELT